MFLIKLSIKLSSNIPKQFFFPFSLNKAIGLLDMIDLYIWQLMILQNKDLITICIPSII